MIASLRSGKLASALLVGLVALNGDVQAQGVSGLTGGGGPLEIEADEGIEWRRGDQVYIARGNATATRGDVTVKAKRLIAHYRTQSDGDGTKIHRIVAEQNVRLISSQDRAFGDRGVYNLDKAVMVLTGRNLRFETGEQRITAEDSLEYWTARKLAIARGGAVAVNAGRRISAEILAAHLAGSDAAHGASTPEVARIEAFDNVRMESGSSFVRGDKAVYIGATRMATLYGNVRVARGDNQLSGGYAEVNLETGVSRLLGAPPDAKAKARVRGLIRPEDDGLAAPNTDGGGRQKTGGGQ